MYKYIFVASSNSEENDQSGKEHVQSMLYLYVKTGRELTEKKQVNHINSELNHERYVSHHRLLPF